MGNVIGGAVGRQAVDVDMASAPVLQDSTGDLNDCTGNAAADDSTAEFRGDPPHNERKKRKTKTKSKLLQRKIPSMGKEPPISGRGDLARPAPKMRNQVQQEEEPTSSSTIVALQSPSTPSVSVGGPVETTVSRSVIVPSNPLLMEDVMEHVFQYITCQPDKDVSTDLKNFRRVCKPWKNAATRLFRRIFRIMRFGTKETQLAYKGRKPIEVTLYTFGKLGKFLETMKYSEMVPFQRYEITGSLDTYANQQLIEDFLRICGPTAVSAEFRFKCTSNFRGSFELEGPSELDLPKLRTLFVGIDDHFGLYSSSEASISVYFTGVVLNAAKSLRKLTLELNLPEPMSYYNESSLKTFEKEICQHMPKSVKILDLQNFLMNNSFTFVQTFTYLIERGLALEELIFDPCYVAGGSEAIHSFLTKQSGHLKTLRIKSSNVNPEAPMLEFPVLHKLETLTVAYVCVIPFSFAGKFPKLICLEVTRWENEETFLDFLECAAESASSMKKIHLTLPNAFSMAPIIQQFAEYFPGITELRLDQATHYQNGIGEVLEEVFAHLSNLRTLHVTIREYRAISLDSILSGVSEEDCKRIRNGRNFDNVNLAGMQHKPSMLNLTRLRKLMLEFKGHYRNLKSLTEFSIYFVFLKMAQLKELTTFEFTLSTRSKISKTYLQRLKDKVCLAVE